VNQLYDDANNQNNDTNDKIVEINLLSINSPDVYKIKHKGSIHDYRKSVWDDVKKPEWGRARASQLSDVEIWKRLDTIL